MAYKVFFSYAHKDEEWLQKLKAHLAPLKSQGLIDQFWYDGEISAGTEWEPEIVKQLDSADIILLLISSSFMNSDYCYGKELKQAIERHNRKEAQVIPIILSPVYWQVPPLDKLQALPKGAKPITGSAWHSVDEAFVNVVNGIRGTIKIMQKRPKQSTSRFQSQVTYITEQVKQGKPALMALRDCDVELADLLSWITAITPPDPEAALSAQAQLEKLIQDIAVVGDGDLSVQAEVTPDVLGIIADSFNYMIEELAKLVAYTRRAANHSIDVSTEATKLISEQGKLTERIAQELLQIREAFSKERLPKQLENAILLLLDLHRRIELLHYRVMYMHEVSEYLLALTSTYKLPAWAAQLDLPAWAAHPDTEQEPPQTNS